MNNTIIDFYRELCANRGFSNVDENFSLSSYRENVFEKQIADEFILMFCRGGGKELYPKDGKIEKAASIYSSSMLAYNFFHKIPTHPLTFEGITYNRVIFEEQFRVLQTRNNKANLDVVLISEDGKTLLLLESKFTEHLSKGATDLSQEYDSKDAYFSNGEDWVRIMKSIRSRMQNKDAYYHGLKQIACHLIGISSAIKNPIAREWFNQNSWMNHLYGIRIEDVKQIIFKSIVYHPKTKGVDVLSCNYEDSVRDFIKGINFVDSVSVQKAPIITYKDLWEGGLKDAYADEPDLVNYLERYLAVHK